MTDTAGVITYLSRSISFPFKTGMVVSLPAYLRSIHPADKTRVLGLLKKAKQLREEFQADYRVIGDKGLIRWVTGSATPRFSDDGDFLGYAGAIVDVTGRYEALELLAKSEAAHRLLTENSSDLISHHAPNTGTYLYASPSFERVLGFTSSDLVGGMSIYDHVHQDDEKVIHQELVNQLSAPASGTPIEFRVRHKNGHYRWISASIKVLTDPVTDEKIGAVAVSRDITAEREAKDELRRREERFRSLTNLSSDWYWETDEQDRFTFLSEGTQRPSKLPPQLIIGKTRRDLAADLNQGGLQTYFMKVARREPFKDIRYETNGPATGSVSHALISGEPIFENGSFKGYRGTGRDITQEVQTSEKLTLLAEENEALVENSLDIIALLDDEGRLLRVNKAAAEILGYQPQELLGRQYAELLHPEELEQAKMVDARLRTGKNTIQDFETRWICKDGRIVHLSVAVRWSAPKRVMYATARDITERYRTRAALQKAKGRLDSMLESIGEAFFALDTDWRITYVNRKAAAFVDLAAEDALGRILWEVVPELRLSSSFQHYQKAMSAREKVFYESFWEPASAWLEVRIYPNDEGLSVYFHDITAKRKAEDSLRKREQRFRSLFEQAGDSIIILDGSLRIQDANQRACQALGYTREELLDLPLSDIEPHFNPDRQFWNELRNGQTHLIQGVKKRKDGTTFPTEAHMSRFEEDNEEFFQSIARDMDEREKAQRKIRESEQRFREVIEITPAGYLLVDAQGQLVDVNPALCNVSGYTKEELIGQNIASLFPKYLCDGALFVQRGPTSVHGAESVIRHKQGHDVHALANIGIKRDVEGNSLSLTAFVTDITERKQVEARLERLATHDTLTGLANRAFLHNRVQQMLDSAPRDSSIAVMFIDLDRFKQVNDSFGHEAGDILLCEVAKRLQATLRPHDTIARLGGDEFVVATYCSAKQESAAKIAEKLLSQLATPVDVGGHRVFVGASIGISMFPEDGQTKELLFQNADTAMYRAKAAGRNGYCFFEQQMSIAAKTRMMLELSLRSALENQEFVIHYQPRIDLKTMMIVGMEALIKWHHPELGLVAPLQFIPIAEETGLIEPLGRWVLEESCRQARQLMDRFKYPLCVSVNVSARQLKCPAIVRLVQTVLEESRLPPHLLELELTESALIEDMERSAGLLKELKGLGIKLAVDDFGTGYSGLAYLRRFPLDVLKLDRSFVMQQDEGISSSRFIKAFVDMAHALNLYVVAEGVETNEILQFLRSVACDEAQGYLLAKPLSLNLFEEYLANALARAPAISV